MSTPKTVISIEKDAFYINGKPTYPGRHFNGQKIEGLLLNSRMVQGVFDDLNPQTRDQWRYPDGPWDAQRNCNEFIAAMPDWYAAGLVAFTLNCQGGSPEGYSKTQPWDNSAFAADGTLREDYKTRIAKVLDAADELSMVVILGLYYFGQDQRVQDEAAVQHSVDEICDWLVERQYRHVLIEIANEVDVRHYTHEILTETRCHELIERVQQRTAGRLDTPEGRLLASTSMKGGSLPTPAIASCSDFILLHGNHVDSPSKIRQMVIDCRKMSAYNGQPILFNEDDHFDFDAQDNHMLAAVENYAGWGYFDYRLSAAEGYDEGYQSVPVNWRISSDRKRGFFKLLSEISGVSN